MKLKHLETINVCAFFLIIISLLSKRPVFLYIGLTLIGISIFVKPLARIIAVGWLKFSILLGTANSKIILTVFFYLFLTPLALVRKLGRHNLLAVSKPRGETYWKTKNKEFGKENMSKTW